jgi:hypothetical protein
MTPTSSIAGVRWRQPSCIEGRIRSVRVQPMAGIPTLQCTVVDATGGIGVVFLGRRQIAGIRPGVHIIVEGIAGTHQGRLAILNPAYELLAS